MIGLVLRLPLVLALLVPLAWAAVLLEAGAEVPLLERSLSNLGAAYPSQQEQGVLLGKGIRVASAVTTWTPALGGGYSPLIHAGLVVTGVHQGAVLGILQITLLLSTCGACAGLVFRERMR